MEDCLRMMKLVLLPGSTAESIPEIFDTQLLQLKVFNFLNLCNFKVFLLGNCLHTIYSHDNAYER